jgi:aspartyl-tRNA(Asn)/glutamyl-tRNA(Gln) amidotransferase subunit A
MSNLTKLTIKEAHDGLVKKEFSALELAEAHLEKIEKENEKIFAYLTVTKDLAIAQAKVADEGIAKGEKLPLLAGVPCAIKDIILVEGAKCTAASKILENYVAPYDATVIKKLKDQGAVILGKTNLDEFAMGSSTENSAFGTTRNPRDFERVPGGSSGGSAAAVAGDLAVFALGTDTGGSIRQPAFLCGVAGLKPTYGAVSRYGVIAYASSLDQVGPLAKTVEDAKIVFEAISGKDLMDSTSLDGKPKEDYSGRKFTIGVPKEYFIKGIDPEIEKIIRAKIKQYESLGHKIEEVSLPHTEYALACYYIIATSEASANLAKFDGIRFGYSSKEAKNLLDIYLQSRGQGFGAEVRRRIMLGTYVLSAGYYDAYYIRAQKVRALIKRDFDRAFEKVDAIFTPTSPSLAFKFGERTDDPLQMYLSDIFTVSVNLAGMPAISVPCGKVGHLPVGLQVIGKPFEEAKIFEIAGKLEERI